MALFLLCLLSIEPYSEFSDHGICYILWVFELGLVQKTSQIMVIIADSVETSTLLDLNVL